MDGLGIAVAKLVVAVALTACRARERSVRTSVGGAEDGMERRRGVELPERMGGVEVPERMGRLAIDSRGELGVVAMGDGAVELDSVSSAMVSISAWLVGIAASSSAASSVASWGKCVAMISCCSRTRLALSCASPNPALARRRTRRGMERSRGISRSSSGGARSMAANSDCSQRTKVSILLHERRNWSASARTRMTKRFLCHISILLHIDKNIESYIRSGYAGIAAQEYTYFT